MKNKYVRKDMAYDIGCSQGADCGSDHELLLPNSNLNWRK